MPVAIETSSAMGPRTTEFLRELGYHLRQTTGEAKASTYLTQRLLVATETGNMASVLDTISLLDVFEEFIIFIFITEVTYMLEW